MGGLGLLEYLQQIYTFKEEGLYLFTLYSANSDSNDLGMTIYVIPDDKSNIPKTSTLQIPFYGVFPKSIFKIKYMFLPIELFVEKHKYYVERFIDLINNNLKTNIKKK